MEIEPFVQRLPKVELHVHLEGTLTAEMRWSMAQRNGVSVPFESFDAMKATYGNSNDDVTPHRIGRAGLATFLEQYYGGMEALRTASDFYDLAIAYLQKAAEMNVRHAEIFFDPQAHTRRGVPIEAIMKGLMDAKNEAEARLQLTCAYILCFLRDEDVESAKDMYEICRPYQHSVFCGIGLDSNEHQRPPSLFDDIFHQARRDGLKVTSHCDFGQQNTHEHIRQVVTELAGGGLDRIDHGLNAADRPELVEKIRQRDMGMTLCPQAYHRRWPEDKVFPVIRRLFDGGIKVTINSDDPTYMQNCWLVENMQLVRSRCPFADEEMIQLVRHAIEVSWATETRKSQLYKELEEFR